MRTRAAGGASSLEFNADCWLRGTAEKVLHFNNAGCGPLWHVFAFYDFIFSNLTVDCCLFEILRNNHIMAVNQENKQIVLDFHPK